LSFSYGCDIILPLHLFSAISYLSLSGIRNTSFDGLAGEVKSDTKSSVSSLRSSTRSVYGLNLAQCCHLKDISEIGKIITLEKVSISSCSCISDFSVLSNIEELKLDVGTYWRPNLNCLVEKNRNP
jgi:hypothetical protein